MADQSIIERAFVLARDRRCRSIDDIKRVLKAERFDSVEAHLAGHSIKRQLSEALKAQSEELRPSVASA